MLRLGVSNSFVSGLIIVTFGGYISYVWGLVFLTFGGLFSYIWWLVYLTFGGYKCLRLGVNIILRLGVRSLTFGGGSNFYVWG